jgi:hypothetical protein
MTRFFVASIVEGHGEVEAVPLLLERILREARPDALLTVSPPLRVKAGSFLQDHVYFAKYLELAARKAIAREGGSVLVLLDSEDFCPAELGPALARRAAAVRNDVPILIALAHREYETWFVAAAPSLRGARGLPADLAAPPEPQRMRDAKGWLSRQMSSAYNEPNDQPAFTRQFSFDQASAVPSFARLRARLHQHFTR